MSSPPRSACWRRWSGSFSCAVLRSLRSMLDRLRVRSGLRAMTDGPCRPGLWPSCHRRSSSSGHGALHVIGTLDLSLRTVAILFVPGDCGVDRVAWSRISRRLVFFIAPDRFARRSSPGPRFWLWSCQAPTSIPTPPAVIGMSAPLAASVIGGPLTMTFIALETALEISGLRRRCSSPSSLQRK